MHHIPAHTCPHMHSHPYTCMLTHMHRQPHTTHMHAHTHAQPPTCTHVHTHAQAATHVHAHTCTHAQPLTCIHAHTCTGSHIHAHVHTHAHGWPLSFPGIPRDTCFRDLDPGAGRETESGSVGPARVPPAQVSVSRAVKTHSMKPAMLEKRDVASPSRPPHLCYAVTDSPEAFSPGTCGAGLCETNSSRHHLLESGSTPQLAPGSCWPGPGRVQDQGHRPVCTPQLLPQPCSRSLSVCIQCRVPGHGWHQQSRAYPGSPRSQAQVQTLLPTRLAQGSADPCCPGSVESKEPAHAHTPVCRHSVVCKPQAGPLPPVPPCSPTQLPILVTEPVQRCRLMNRGPAVQLGRADTG